VTEAVADPGGASAERMVFGFQKSGAVVEAVTLSNARGVSARILTLGAALQSLIMPDAKGAPADIILGHDDVSGYEAIRGFLGVTVGRYANRIAGGRFPLDGMVYRLDQNDGPNTLHGGDQGFDRALWTIGSVTTGAEASAMFRHVSPDGHGGFPGEVEATVTYTLDGTGDLTILFEARTTRSTVINMTNHALFNLAGAGAMADATLHRLTIPASAYTPVDRQLIPTGELRLVDGTVFDFREGRVIADGVRDGRDAQIAIGRGYDHNFRLDKGQTAQPQFAARLEEPISGRRVDVLTTEPGLQLYTGNSLDGSIIGKRRRVYRMGDGIALEPQKFPDTPNRPAFGSARVDPGQIYRHLMIYRLSVID
jgi:aldose 1-epimerase